MSSRLCYHVFFGTTSCVGSSKTTMVPWDCSMPSMGLTESSRHISRSLKQTQPPPRPTDRCLGGRFSDTTCSLSITIVFKPSSHQSCDVTIGRHPVMPRRTQRVPVLKSSTPSLTLFLCNPLSNLTSFIQLPHKTSNPPKDTTENTTHTTHTQPKNHNATQD